MIAMIMEILIVGVILVALMVYASTKIKRSAAEAFEEEVVETDEFSIVKPDGFISPVEPGDGLIFAANSAEFGFDEAENTRHAAAGIRFHAGVTLEAAAARISSGASVLDETSELLGGRRARLTEIHEANEGVPVTAFYKFIETGSGTFELVVRVLPEQKTEYSRRIEQMLSSFLIK
jgi:hypothetical protein